MIRVNTIRDEVCLDPQDLDHNVYSYIKKHVSEKNNQRCHRQYGYILNISDDTIRILGNTISRVDEKIIVQVEYNAKTLLLEVDDILEANINIIMSCGIFLNIHNVIDILVTKDKLEKQGFRLYEDHVQRQDSKYSKGDKLKIQIVKTKYDKGKFLYIADVV